jgi:hypothetical protein
MKLGAFASGSYGVCLRQPDRHPNGPGISLSRQAHQFDQLFAGEALQQTRIVFFDHAFQQLAFFGDERKTWGISIIKYFPSGSILPPLKLAIRLKFFRDLLMPSRDSSSGDIEPPA